MAFQLQHSPPNGSAVPLTKATPLIDVDNLQAVNVNLTPQESTPAKEGVRKSSRSTKGIMPARLGDYNLCSQISSQTSSTATVNAVSGISQSSASGSSQSDLESANANAGLSSQINALQLQLANLMSRLEASETDRLRLQNLVFSANQAPRPNVALNETQVMNNAFQPANYCPSAASLESTSNATPSNHIVSSLSSQTYVPHRPKLHDLPPFSGAPEEWPIFIACYNESTAAYGYTPLENMLRLQKSLRGLAKETVETILIHPSSIQVVIDQLEFRFGRAEHLIRSQLSKVRLIHPIPDNRIDLVIPFATKVQNLCTILETTKSQQHLANPMLLDELVSKLPIAKRLEWVQFSHGIQPYPSVKDFSTWIQEYAKIASIATYTHFPVAVANKPPRSNRHDPVLHAIEKPSTSANYKSTRLCPMCLQKHNLVSCTAYAKLDTADRWKLVKEKSVCFACLVPGHVVSSCRSKVRCEVDSCRRFHHRLLHETQKLKDKSNTEPSKDEETSVTYTESNFHASSTPRSKVLFRVLPVKLYGPNGEISTHALLDDGSSVTILNESIASQLSLVGRPQTMSLTWIGQKETSQASFLVNLEISGVAEGSRRFQLRNVRTHNDLSLPVQSMNLRELKTDKLKKLPIQEYQNAVPNILIGLDNWRLIVGDLTILDTSQGPAAVRTLLGWVVYGGGGCDKQESDPVLHIYGCCSDNVDDNNLSQLVSDFISLDNVDPAHPIKPIECADNIRATKLLKDTTLMLNNRYETGLLWKSDEIVLPNSLSMAKRRLTSVKRSLSKDPSYAADYETIIDSYVAKGYARKLTLAEAEIHGPRTWYLPHFCVRNAHRPGKLRLVFDAAASVHGTSLNASLLRGPEQCQNLLAVLLKFREKPIGVCADIAEMFHQIIIRKEDQDAQRFLWQRNGSDTLETYVMQVMVFGATCSPCSAEYIKNINAMRFADKAPKAYEAIKYNHYVDDLVCSFDDEDEAFSVTSDIIKIHQRGGFKLCKFSSNSTLLLNRLEEKCAPDSTANMDIDRKIERVLGMYWIPAEDVFTFRLKFNRSSHEITSDVHWPTKRECLSILMSVYDPFGLLADFTVHAKLMLQSLWRRVKKWDEQVPADIYLRWKKWMQKLVAVEEMRVPRCYLSGMCTIVVVQLHIFVDASEEAFAAAGYWRIVDRNNNIRTAFVMGKTRCAPIKLISIPRLELQAAVLGARIRRSILQLHNMQPATCTLWSDSRTVLSWIKSGDPGKYKPFVGHRVAEVLELSNLREWRWVPTLLNVADVATRSKYLPRYQPTGRWITGPDFLLEDESAWPSELNYDTSLDNKPDDELRADYRHRILHLKRVTAWMLRCLRVPQKPPKHKVLDVSELQYAEIVLCRMVQKHHYSDEYAALKSGQQVIKSSHLYKLTPCLDENNVIRLSGRIDSAVCVPIQTRRPIILPKDSWLSKIIVKEIHELFFHQNAETIVCEVRRKFWIPHLRVLVKMVVRECQYCKINSAKPKAPQMGQLPEDRLTPFVRPFTFTGVDYMGPFLVAIGRRREKRWVALFTCLTVRAVHLEIAVDLSTDAFIICLRNFVNRRGIPVRIRSDNGTNFVGADRELKSKLDLFDHGAIQNFLSSKGIQWVFNCPANPSAGGCWERLVRSVKRVLHVALKDVVPREETWRSVLIEAENIVNSRPLTQLPLASEDEDPLTPNHFILGCANSTQTPGPDENGPICLRKQWRIAQSIKDRFWHRWVAEYLPDLVRRTKWYAKVKPLETGDLVIICDTNVARSCWRRGRVIKVHPGRDGQVRSAEVQTTIGVLRRPVCKLAKLDVGESQGVIHGGRDVAIP